MLCMLVGLYLSYSLFMQVGLCITPAVLYICVKVIVIHITFHSVAPRSKLKNLSYIYCGSHLRRPRLQWAAAYNKVKWSLYSQQVSHQRWIWGSLGWEITQVRDPRSLETQGRRHRKSKTGVSVAPQKGQRKKTLNWFQQKISFSKLFPLIIKNFGVGWGWFAHRFGHSIVHIPIAT